MCVKKSQGGLESWNDAVHPKYLGSELILGTVALLLQLPIIPLLTR